MSYRLEAVDPARLRLSGELTIYNAAAFKRDLLALLRPGADRELDLGGVEECDTAGIQLLLLAKRVAADQGGGLTFVNHSEPLLAVIALLNLAREFADPLFIPSAAAGEVA